MSRERWHITLTCSSCGTEGKASVSENDYPFMRKLDFNVDSVDEGFKVKRLGDGWHNREITCVKCGGVAK